MNHDKSPRASKTVAQDASPAPLRWETRTFEQLDAASLYSILAERTAVFIVEQECAYQDADGLDPDALHLCAWSSPTRLQAYARITPPGSRFDEPSIGRVLTALQARGTGLGHLLMERALAATRKHFGPRPIRISAQSHLQPFYQRHGFRTASAPYDEDGIEHVDMLR